MNGPDPRGALGRAAQALRFWERTQSVVSNNLANVNTPGFKGERAFARLLDEASLAVETATDHRVGAVTITGRPLDIAMESDGYFVVETPAGERLTRGGGLQIIDDTLADGAGNPILGKGGRIELPPASGGDVRISPQGIVTVDGLLLDELRVVEPLDPQALSHEAAGLFRPDGTLTEDVVPEKIRIRQGALEESNVNPVEALVDLLDVQRSHQSVERSIRVLDDILATVTSRIGRVE